MGDCNNVQLYSHQAQQCQLKKVAKLLSVCVGLKLYYVACINSSIHECYLGAIRSSISAVWYFNLISTENGMHIAGQLIYCHSSRILVRVLGMTLN